MHGLLVYTSPPYLACATHPPYLAVPVECLLWSSKVRHMTNSICCCALGNHLGSKRCALTGAL
jgi:hypothetical protein